MLDQEKVDQEAEKILKDLIGSAPPEFKETVEAIKEPLKVILKIAILTGINMEAETMRELIANNVQKNLIANMKKNNEADPKV